MSAETIKSFLVSLGFQLDEAGARKFEATIVGTTKTVMKMGLAVESAGLSVVAFTAKIAQGLDQLYFASQRTGASVEGIKALGYAASQAGVSAESAKGSLESLSRFMRNNPGAEGFLNRLGVQTRDARGRMRDMASIFTGVGQRLSTMPHYRANQYAQMLGIDENTLMAMRRGMGRFTGEYNAMAKAIGFNADHAAVSSNKFMTSLRSFGEMAGMARDKIGSNLADGLSGSIDRLRRQIIDNFPKIETVITKGVKGILWMGEALGRIIFRMIQAGEAITDWWKGLDSGSKKLIMVFGALVVAWRLLNSAFLTSPIGIIISLATAIGLLWEDYQTWKEGGKSLIDWKGWEKQIDSALENIKVLRDTIISLGKEVAKLLNIDLSSWSLQWEFENLSKNLGDLGQMLDKIAQLLNAIKDGRWSDAARIGKELLDQGKGNQDAIPEVTATAVRHREAVIDFYRQINGKVNQFLPEFLGGTPANSASSSPNEGVSSVGGSGPRGIRNNNPGNIDFRGQKGATLERPGGRFARFKTAFDGLQAMSKQLLRYFDGKTTGKRLQTIRDIISTWAPGNENNTGAYISQMSKKLGVSPDVALNLRDPKVMSALMNGIVQHENGRNPYSSDLVHRAAQSGIGGNSFQQETNIHIHGVSDPRQAGQEVAQRQQGVNSRATQQMQKKVT
ncbi:lytic transglycosylase [Budviciaceae bacterium BWR-B9]|uniref:Lytic transglycosylase n=1 Tax=Limnobaculum allomyrinae TaxID=2791986 RepID=A0ABS1IW85_9GAMM|nr:MULTISPECIES: lytic transglycosylase [Limnobaculum]MBK5145842.1 lytic transglycosylase [Limnobaculum allomyrinae]MBV7693850.1 lytic transglycosylase [Limnobaculum sp. M2-1]